MAASSAKKSSIYDPRYRRIVGALVRLRENAGMSQAALALSLGLSQPDISKIERCERRIDVLEVIDWVLATKGDIHALLDNVTEEMPLD